MQNKDKITSFKKWVITNVIMWNMEDYTPVAKKVRKSVYITIALLVFGLILGFMLWSSLCIVLFSLPCILWLLFLVFCLFIAWVNRKEYEGLREILEKKYVPESAKL